MIMPYRPCRPQIREGAEPKPLFAYPLHPVTDLAIVQQVFAPNCLGGSKGQTAAPPRRDVILTHPPARRVSPPGSMSSTLAREHCLRGIVERGVGQQSLEIGILVFPSLQYGHLGSSIAPACGRPPSRGPAHKATRRAKRSSVRALTSPYGNMTRSDPTPLKVSNNRRYSRMCIAMRC